MTGASEAAFRSVRELGAGFRSGALSPIALTEACLARVAALNSRFKAFITVLDDEARAAAQRAGEAFAAGQDAGPLHGIPYAVKDLVQTKGLRTTGGSRVLADWRPDEDAHLVERMAGAGAVLLGKANLHEFAYGATGENPVYGTVPNPYDEARLAGGSSSGSAAAVACGLVPAAFGTDTGGSVRVPAALCGLVGLKPTLGLIGTRGVIPYSWSLDHIGIMTRSCGDAALLLDAVAGPDPKDPNSLDLPAPACAADPAGGVKGLRIGVPEAFYFERVEPEIAAAVRGALGRLEGLGATLVAVELPSMAHARTVSLTVQMPEALSYHGPFLAERAELYGADLRSGLALGQFLLAEHYVRAKRIMERYRREMARVFDAVDLVVTPTCPLVAPEIGTVTVTMEGQEEAAGNALTRLTTFFNMTGNPALSVPCGLHSTGLPMGLQIVGKPFDETTVLRAGHAVEAMADCRVPPPALEGLEP